MRMNAFSNACQNLCRKTYICLSGLHLSGNEDTAIGGVVCLMVASSVTKVRLKCKKEYKCVASNI